MIKSRKITLGFISTALFVTLVAGLDWHLKTQSVTYVDESGETRLEGHPSANFLGGKAFAWFVEQEPTKNVVIVKLYSESGHLQGRYQLLLSESQRGRFTTRDIIFFNNNTFTLSGGDIVNSRLLSR